MNSRFKTNNLIAILVAIILFATGFVLYFMHQQSKPNETLGQVRKPATVIAYDVSFRNQPSLDVNRVTGT